MKNILVICLLSMLLFLASCQQEDEGRIPEKDPAEALYGIWNRLAFGFMDCEDPLEERKQFGEGSVSFAQGGFYSTYSLRNGGNLINTVNFEVQGDTVLFISTQTKWRFEVIEDQLRLSTNAERGCLRYFEFVKSSNDL